MDARRVNRNCIDQGMKLICTLIQGQYGECEKSKIVHYICSEEKKRDQAGDMRDPYREASYNQFQ